MHVQLKTFEVSSSHLLTGTQALEILRVCLVAVYSALQTSKPALFSSSITPLQMSGENMPLISTPSVSILKPLLHLHFTVIRNLIWDSAVLCPIRTSMGSQHRARDKMIHRRGELRLCSCFGYGAFHRKILIPVG